MFEKLKDIFFNKSFKEEKPIRSMPFEDIKEALEPALFVKNLAWVRRIKERNFGL